MHQGGHGGRGGANEADHPADAQLPGLLIKAHDLLDSALHVFLGHRPGRYYAHPTWLESQRALGEDHGHCEQIPERLENERRASSRLGQAQRLLVLHAPARGPHRLPLD